LESSIIFLSWRFPSPTASVERNTPDFAFSVISLTSSSSLVTPTLKSPSVQRMTRFVPPLMKPFTAVSYANWMPPAPFVEPDARRLSIA